MRSSRWSSPGRSARSGVVLGLALFAVYAATLATHAAPGERIGAAGAHVLLSAESIVSDHDLDVADEYRDRAWEGWYHRPLHPTARADAAGRVFEPQGVGLPLLVAPAWAAGGVVAVRLWLAALAAVAFACAAALARRIVPDPWATGAALAVGLSPPAVFAATAVRPEMPAAAALAAAAVLALRIRDRPDAATAFWAALLVAAVPWLGLTAALPAGVVALALARWLRRRRRALSGFVALEVVFTSAVVFVTIDDRLFGGLTPYAARLHPGPASGLHDAAGALARIPRLGVLVGETLLWAPVTALALVALGLLWRSRRGRLAVAVAGQVDVEVVAAFAALVAATQLVAVAVLAPRLHGPWFPARFVVPVLPFVAALAAWGLRRFPRAGLALALVTVGLTAWILVAAVAGDATLAPPRGLF